MVKVKICGLTTAEDARDALLFGADYLGFIFHAPSPRAVTVEEVCAIVRKLKDDPDTGRILAQTIRPLLIGVFVNRDPAAIAETLKSCGLDLAQLSGEEGAAVVARADSAVYRRAYKALRPPNAEVARVNVSAYSAPTSGGAPTLLLDTYHPTLRGGTGETTDWQLAAELARATPRLMLAGGLTPDNVTNAIRQVQPYAVDVASGVEAIRGIKDPDKVRQFIIAAHASRQ